MPTDLHARALDQEALLRTAGTRVTDALVTARDELKRRHEASDTVDPSAWGTDLGALQHREVAVAALESVRSRQTATRAALAAIANPADADTFEAELRDLMVEEAAMRVQLRHAHERVAAGEATVKSLATLSGRVETELKGAATRTAWGEEHHDRGDELRLALTVPPLDTLVADATAVRGGAAMTDASDRIDDLLPGPLRARAEERADEAAATLDRARVHMATVSDRLADLDAAAAVAGVATATRQLRAAESALAAYVAGAAGRLAAAISVLERVAELPALSAVQDAAIAARLADSGDAIDEESALAAAVAALLAAEGDVDDAIVGAWMDDPDANAEDDQDVIDARSAVAGAAIQDPLSAARGAYDPASRAALDALEVEVPPEVWSALVDLTAATRALDELADGATRDALVQDLDDAEDALAAVLDERDIAARVRWRVATAAASRHGILAATEATAVDRRRQYVHGDGASGRTPIEL